MLSMKTLRVAIVAMGSALLLGPALAVAQDDTIQLDGTMGDAPMPLVYAQETLPAMADAMGRRALELENNIDVAVMPRRAIGANEELYIRIDLTGAQFGRDPTFVSGAPDGALGTAVTGTESSGGADESFAVFRIAGAVESDNLVGVRIGGGGAAGDLQVTATTGNVTAAIVAYTNPDDALDERGATGTFAGSAAIIRLVSGLTVTIKAAPTAIASVDTGFQRFVGGGGTARLGWLGVEENENVMAGVRSAVTGIQLARGNILTVDNDNDPVGMISFNVMGNLDIGAFTIKPETFELDVNDEMVLGDDGNPIPTGTCDGGAEDTVDRGTLMDAEGMPLIGEEGELPSGADSAGSGDLAPGIHLLCLNVDVTGPMSNMAAILEGGYSATAHYKGTATAAAQMAGEEGMLGSIDRDGASVNIPYLTTSVKHNQRLIIVNRGTRPVAITSIQFNTEAGTDAELMAPVQAAMEAGLIEIPGGATWVARMDQTLNITGDSRRTAATIAFAGTKGVLSVATTQINFADSSTDTVVYTVE